MSAQKGEYTAFVKWDDEKTGGRFFECNYFAFDGGKYEVYCHDGDSGYFPGSNIIPIVYPENISGPCIAYWDDRPYAFRGQVISRRKKITGPFGIGHGEYDVLFADGDRKWVHASRVYPLKTL